MEFCFQPRKLQSLQWAKYPAFSDEMIWQLRTHTQLLTEKLDV